LKEKIKNRKIRFIIAVGVREELRKYFAENVKGLKLDGWVHILSGITTDEYFKNFNERFAKQIFYGQSPLNFLFTLASAFQ